MPENKLERPKSVSSKPMSPIAPPPPPPPSSSLVYRKSQEAEKAEKSLDEKLEDCINGLSKKVSSKVDYLIKIVRDSKEYNSLSPENKLKAIEELAKRAVEGIDNLTEAADKVVKNTGRTVNERAAASNWKSMTSDPEVFAELRDKLDKIREGELKLKKLNREISKI